MDSQVQIRTYFGYIGWPDVRALTHHVDFLDLYVSVYFRKSRGQLLSPFRPFMPHDLNRFRTLQKASNKELQAALKLSQKRAHTHSDDED
jgi:hypothetical protein